MIFAAKTGDKKVSQAKLLICIRVTIPIWLIFISLNGFSQITIVLKNANAFPDSIQNNIYVAGNFNEWNPGNKNYLLRNYSGVYSITFTPPKDITTLEYKFTHGDWKRVEVNADGSQKQNRTVNYKPGMIEDVSVEGWDDLLPDKIKEGNKDVIQFTVYSNELKREKNIRVYLPCDYEASNNRYPVIYVLDGQNLFDDVYSPAGEWEIDETMDSICSLNLETSIIVGIDHASDMRLTEYSPWKIKKIDAGGEGDEFAAFVAHTLKPKIDAMYRTVPFREYTAIAGSSMGGLMSLYIVLNYNDVFSKAGVFSPAFQTSEQNYKNAERYDSALPTKIFFVAGSKEGGDYDMMFNMQKMYYLLLKKQIPELQMRYTIESDAQHTEKFWREEFFNAYLWLYENEN
ncbi:MAG: hypothetical protein H7Y00_09545 [Fimbriimonadaceae bacterium]|nr:hypothetical protein [Chitinophagales bacterium]